MKPGKITRQPDGYKVEFERNFNHPIEKVWDAITNPSVLKIWFAEIEMEFKEGARMIIHIGGEPTNGTIVTIKPPHLFEWTWEGELARWELIDVSKTSCVLKLTYSRLAEDYAAKAPAGFHIILDDLEAALNGEVRPNALGVVTEDTVQKEKEGRLKAIYEELVKAIN